MVRSLHGVLLLSTQQDACYEYDSSCRDSAPPLSGPQLATDSAFLLPLTNPSGPTSTWKARLPVCSCG